MPLKQEETKPAPIVKMEKEYECEIDLDTAKVIPTKPSRKSRLSKSSPDRVFDTKPLPNIEKAIILLEELYDGLTVLLMNGKIGKMRLIRKIIDTLKGENEKNE
jgi:hypothetical protein